MQLLIVVVVVAAAAAGVGADEGAAAKSTSTSLLHRGHLGCDFSSITYMRQCVQAPMTSCAQLAVSSAYVGEVKSSNSSSKKQRQQPASSYICS
ncbi:unnamed protein product [Sphagnum balticum]